MTEDDLIGTFFAPLAGAAGLALRDDAACMAPPAGHDLVLTVDAVVAGVHFFADDPPGAIARKALRVNLSDLAAKGARPLGFLLTLALPAGWRTDWLAAFSQGLGADAETFGCPLLGGDTVRTPGPLTISITALGAVPHGTMVARTAARPGDVVAVTGTIGDAALGLALRLGTGAAWAAGLSAERQAELADRYLLPRPRLALAEAVRRHARAAMDVSDGLAGDLAKMLRASGVTGDLDLDRVPLSAAAQAAVAADGGLLATAVTGGDDYELLLALDPQELAPLAEAAARAGVQLTVIGTVGSGQEPLAIRRNGRLVAMERGSYSHF